MLHFRTLGSLDLRKVEEDHSVRSVLAQPRRLALLAYLVLARPQGFHHRNTLLGLFWPDAPDAKGRHALRQALYHLRQSLGEGVIVTRGDDEVGIDPDRIQCDALRFEEEVGENPKSALELYGGELLAGFAIDGCRAFEEWLEIRRIELRRLAVEAALAATGERALEWLQRAAAWAPYDENVLLRLLELLRSEGRIAEAVTTWERFADRLRNDLELEPTARAAAVVETLRTEPAAAPAGEAGSSAPPGAGRAATSEVAALAGASARREGWPSRARITAGGALLTATIAAVLLLPLRPPWGGGLSPSIEAASPARVLVAGFETPAGEGGPEVVVARMASDWIAQGLARTGMIEVVPGSMLLGGDGAGGANLLALAEAARAGSIVDGTVYRQDGALAFQLRITDGTGALLRAIEYRAALDEPVVVSVERLRQRVTGALATVLDPRLTEWADAASQPPSFEAYRQFADGMDLFMRQPSPNYREAALRFRAAAASDSTFTAPLIWAITAHYFTPDFPVADSLARSLEPLRDRLAPWDRAMLDRHLAFLGQDIPGAYGAMRRVVEIAPAPEWRFYLARDALAINRASEALDILLDLDPSEGSVRSFPGYWLTRANARHRLGDFEGELRDVALMRRENQGAGGAIELRALAALGRAEELDRRLAELSSVARDFQRARLLHDAARELYAHGHEEAGAPVLSRALTAYESTPPSDRQSELWRSSYARALFLAERLDEARPLLEVLLADQPGEFGYRSLLGSIAAQSGDPATARRIEADLERERRRFNYGEDTLRRACILAHLGERERALDVVREAFGHGLHHSHFVHLLECLFVLRGDPRLGALLRPQG